GESEGAESKQGTLWTRAAESGAPGRPGLRRGLKAAPGPRCAPRLGPVRLAFGPAHGRSAPAGQGWHPEEYSLALAEGGWGQAREEGSGEGLRPLVVSSEPLGLGEAFGETSDALLLPEICAKKGGALYQR
ncbi:hypothetical protein MC885_012545, partial [Smutsia gigantea]